jgi:hypothetical protein
MRLASVSVVLPLALACTGQFGDPAGSAAPTGSSQGSSDGGGPSAGGSPPVGDGEAPSSAASPPVGDAEAPLSDSAATSTVPSEADGGETCQTSIGSYGYTQCACLQGSAATSNVVAACTGYDCCVRYAPGSGLAEGFGNPALSSDLCACYSSAEIVAIFGGPTTCQAFAGDGTVVSSCP